jgi:phosphatidylglycerophosphatase C
VSKKLALFDFDGTLTRGDSLLPFLKAAAGPIGFAKALALASPWLAGYGLKLVRNDFAKQKLLASALGGMGAERLAELGRVFARDKVPGMLREDMKAVLRQRRDEGYNCVLVSASLDLYLKPWAQEEQFVAVLCSQLSYDAKGRATGKLLGTNCYGEEKVRRIEDWLQSRERPRHIVAYGDTPGDGPMLALADQAFWVRRDRQNSAITAG